MQNFTRGAEFGEYFLKFSQLELLYENFMLIFLFAQRFPSSKHIFLNSLLACSFEVSFLLQAFSVLDFQYLKDEILSHSIMGPLFLKCRNPFIQCLFNKCKLSNPIRFLSLLTKSWLSYKDILEAIEASLENSHLPLCLYYLNLANNWLSISFFMDPFFIKAS